MPEIRNSGILPYLLLLSSFAGGCAGSFHDIGRPPELSRVNSDVPIDTATQVAAARPPARPSSRFAMRDNALWNKRHGIYFRDTRAYEVGDILTVSIAMNDSAKINNRSDSDSALSGSLAGAATYSLPAGASPAASVDGSLTAKVDAERGGSINRSEKIFLQVAAVVVAASPNGNLQISGSQEVRVNHELRILTVEGIVRSKDILPDNTIPYEKIAEARISYGGHNTRPRRAAGTPASPRPSLLRRLLD